MKLDPDQRFLDALKMSVPKAIEEGEADGFSFGRWLHFMSRASAESAI